MRRNVRATQGSSENRQAEEDLPGIVSKLLAQIGVPITVATLKECVPAIWVALYEGLFQVRIPGLLRGPPASTEQGRLHNVRLVIGELSKTVLRTDLSHIIPSKVVRGDTATVANLIQIFRELGRVVERGSENLNERAADRSGLSREAAGNSEGAFESEEDYETDDAPGSDPETDDLDHDDDENDQPAGIPSNSSGHYAETLEHELDISGISEVAPESQFDSDEDLAPPPPGISHSPPKKRRRRAGSATDIATTVTDDISEYLQSQGNEATSTSGRTRNANTSLGTSLRREKSSVSHREQPVGTRRKATPTVRCASRFLRMSSS
ncbi:uncharacterized protein EV422DRAFT_154894 [Fimicolochytrium jonesii]|uniref:uncharacterized protein n=1 Tax=Fimicolochytrium jonesii TaxID=1396493 RepID=UPI0022FEFEBF|nr:uncharacterized protein EV422DRAFT_154894 [Fimicolochytrium jonesii]KAI8826124.1 hypothetical protein EV422DRAFT_154894 [Fimicolochytrium jonesii]